MRAALGMLGIACGASTPPPPTLTEPPTVATTSAAPAEPAPEAPFEPGARELVRVLERHDAIADPAERWTQRAKTFAQLRALADPRGADALHAYLERAASWPASGERVHFRTEAALALAEIGDLRALPALVERLGLDALDVYSEESPAELELRRTDQERVVCARLIADLADLHPNELAAIRAQAEKAVWAWVTGLPSPHANGLRALAKMNSDDKKIRVELRRWADPKRPLPPAGAQPPFPEEFVIAQMALRHIGAIGDEKAFAIAAKQLKRRPPKLDATMDGLLGGGLAILGMSLRALEVGASDGLSELGDARAVPALMKLVDDRLEHEHARMSACKAATWLASDQDAAEIAQRIESSRGGADKATHFRASCWLSALVERPLAPVVPTLFAFVQTGPAEHAEQAARALGNAGLGPDEEAKLLALTAAPAVGVSSDAAALALLLGGSEAAAKRVIQKSSRETDPIREAYSRSFSYVSHEDLETGRLLRWVRNARAAGGDSWAARSLRRQLDDVIYDNGPHSLTRVVLRRRLFERARSGSADASAALELMQERGALAALKP